MCSRNLGKTAQNDWHDVGRPEVATQKFLVVEVVIITIIITLPPCHRQDTKRTLSGRSVRPSVSLCVSHASRARTACCRHMVTISGYPTLKVESIDRCGR